MRILVVIFRLPLLDISDRSLVRERGLLPEFRISCFVRGRMASFLLFSDAESTKNSVENVVGDDDSYDRAELIHRQTYVERDEFISAAVDDDLRRRSQSS
jgi:hypothetical protein